MYVNDELFRLIKSLSKSEKRYFKIFSERHIIRGQNNYIRLFNFLERQPEYDEENVRKYFAGQKFVQHLNVTKNYLTKMIMQSLRAYSDKANPADNVVSLIRDVRILFEKGFSGRAYKVLMKAKREAEHYFLYPKLLEILDLERRIVFRQKSLIQIDKWQKGIYQSKEKLIRLLNNINEYNKLNSLIFIIVRHTNVIREKNEIVALNKIMKNRLLIDEKNALSYYARLNFFDSWAIYYGMIGDHEKSMKIGKRYVNMIESFPHMRDAHPGTYIPALNNFILSCMRLNRFPEAESSIKKLGELKSNSKAVQAEIFQRHSEFELSFCKVTGNYERAVKLIPAIEKEQEKFRSWIQRSLDMELKMQFSCIYLGAQNYKKALHWINFLLNAPAGSLRDDVHCAISIMNLIVHFELGNQELFPYILKSSYRFFYKRDAKYEFEKVFLKNIRKLADANNAQELKEVYKSIHAQLLRLSKKKFERGAFEIFDFVSWLESKIENRPFADVVKQKIRAIKKPS